MEEIGNQRILYNNTHQLALLRFAATPKKTVLAGADMAQGCVYVFDSLFGNQGCYKFPAIFKGIEDYQIINSDSAIFYSQNQFVIADKNGNVLFERHLNDTLNPQDSCFMYHYGSLGNYFPPYYDAAADLLYLSRYRIDVDWWFKEWYSAPVEVVYHFRGNYFSQVPVYYPGSFSKSYLGDLNSVERTISGKENCYAFLGSPEIVFYNRETHRTKRVMLSKEGLDFNVQPYEGDPLDIQPKMDHLKYNPWFLGYYRHPNRTFAIRMLEDGVKEKIGDAYSDFDDKVMVLQLYENDNTLIHTLRLKKKPAGTIAFFSGDTFKIFNGITYANNKTVVDYSCFLLR
ncbi:MAG: hypothetical protein U0T73_05655 [Chitinophagales bacterium]